MVNLAAEEVVTWAELLLVSEERMLRYQFGMREREALTILLTVNRGLNGQLKISNVRGQLLHRIISMGDHGISQEGGLKLDLRREGTGTMVSRGLDLGESHLYPKREEPRRVLKIANSKVIEGS
jgi:hypothetical protein